VDGVTESPEAPARPLRLEARSREVEVGLTVMPSAAQARMLEAARETLEAIGQALLKNGLDCEALAVFVALRRIGGRPDDRFS
jgi:hypothetical protein